MKTTRYDGSRSRRVLAAMVTDRVVVSRVAAKWPREGLFAGRAENLIAGWCVGHSRRYGKAPGREIQIRFDSWAETSKDEKLTEQVGRALQAISDDHESNGEAHSSEYIVDMAGKLFDEVRLKRMVEEVQTDLDAGDVDRARERIASAGRIDLGVDECWCPSEDWDGWRDAFDHQEAEPFFTYPGELGRFIGSEFRRDAFVAIQGSAKRGKSWWLIDAAYRIVKARYKVAYFEAGDLSRRQVRLRLGQRVLRRPIFNDRSGLTKISVPVAFPSKDEPPVMESREMEVCSATECFAAWKRVSNDRPRLRVICRSNNSLSLDSVEAIVGRWAQEDGWVPDAVVIDYADIVAAPAGTKDERDGINENWKRLRRMSQDLHCLVLTATQSDAASYDARLQRRKNFSNDRRKHDHVTFMMALNVGDEDKEIGVTRVNVLDRREGAFIEGAQCHVAGCLAIGCPVMHSCR